jgi:hypothetical protein
MLKKLLGSKSFGTMVSHLAHCQIIIHASVTGLPLPSMVRRATPTFLGCWALIIPTLVSHFQEDDHPIILDVVAHVNIGIYPF